MRSVFSQPMGGKSDGFPFAFLQPTGVGSKTLTVPCVSSSFSWTAQQVAKLGTCKQAIYILAQDELVFPDVPEVNKHAFTQFEYVLMVPLYLLAQTCMPIHGQNT